MELHGWPASTVGLGHEHVVRGVAPATGLCRSLTVMGVIGLHGVGGECKVHRIECICTTGHIPTSVESGGAESKDVLARGRQ